mgnify:CR=1 FL=1
MLCVPAHVYPNWTVTTLDGGWIGWMHLLCRHWSNMDVVKHRRPYPLVCPICWCLCAVKGQSGRDGTLIKTLKWTPKGAPPGNCCSPHPCVCTLSVSVTDTACMQAKAGQGLHTCSAAHRTPVCSHCVSVCVQSRAQAVRALW